MGTSTDGFVKATPDIFLSGSSIGLGSISIYPNPFVSEMHIESNKIDWKYYSLYKMDGSLLVRQQLLDNNKIVFSKNLSRGSYLLQLHDDNNLTLQKLIIKSSR